MDTSYILNILGEERENYFNAVAPPIIQTSNFAFKKVNDLRISIGDELKQPLYSRGLNPTLDMLRKKLAALDEAEDALVFGSGVAAIFVSVIANVQQGDHVVCVNNPYSWTQKLFTDLLPRFGVTCTYIDGTRIENFEKAIKTNTKIIFLESPNTFTFEMQDLEEVAKLAKSKKIVTIIDNSYCTPLYQKPIKSGIDIAIQTATKYIGGHSDAVGGVLCGSKKMVEKIFRSDFLNIGAIMSPFNAWLMLRSLRTFELRVERSSSSAKKIVDYFESHPKIEKMFFPFSKAFPQNELAKKQMKKNGGMFTVALKANSIEQIEKFCNSLTRFLMAVSWGGHESLAFPVCCTIPCSSFDANNVQHRLVRFYIGLEDWEELKADIENSLQLI